MGVGTVNLEKRISSSMTIQLNYITRIFQQTIMNTFFLHKILEWGKKKWLEFHNSFISSSIFEVSSILSGIILTLIICSYFKTEGDNYLEKVRNLFLDLCSGSATELIGALVTILLIERIFNQYNARAAKAKEEEAIAREFRLFSIEIELYKMLFHRVVTPLCDYKVCYEIPNRFNLKDMADLHLTNASIKLNASAIQVFLEVEQNLTEHLRSFLSHNNLDYHQELHKMILDFVETSVRFVSRSVLLENEKLMLKEGKEHRKMTDFIANNLSLNIA